MAVPIKALLEYRVDRDSLASCILAPSTVNVRLAAVRKMVTEAKRNGYLSTEEAENQTEMPNIRQHGTRLGKWLTKEQARELLVVPDRSTVKDKRDHAIFALLLGHTSVQTTERYLGSEQEIAEAVNHGIGL